MKVKAARLKTIDSRIYNFWRQLQDRYKIIPKSLKKARHYEKEDHKKAMQSNAYIIEVLVFWRYNPIS